MLEDIDLNQSKIVNAKVEKIETLEDEGKELIEEKNQKPIFEREEKINDGNSFKPLIFPNEKDSPLHSEVSFDQSFGKTDSEKIELSEGFKNSEFFYENSLLTNAEDFAKSIREGANLYKSELLSKIEQKASDTERIHEQILSKKKEAKQQRDELLSLAKEEVKEIKKEAFQDGFDEGYKNGMQKRYEEAESLVSNANFFLEQLNSLRKVFRYRAEKDLVKLAMKIAKNILAEEIKLNDSVVEGIVSAALQETEMQGKIYLYLNPLDYDFLVKSKCDLETYLNDEQSLILRKRSELKPGTIFVESDGEVISRSIESQFEKIEVTLNEHLEKNEANLNDVEIKPEDQSLRGDIKSGDASNLNSSEKVVSIDEVSQKKEFGKNFPKVEEISENDSSLEEMDTVNLIKEKDDKVNQQIDEQEDLSLKNDTKIEEEVLENNQKL